MSKTKKLSDLDAQQTAQEVYETKYGIWDHITQKPSSKKRPLALVALHESEDNWASSSIKEATRLYFDKEIYKTTGLTLTQFFDLPREYFSLVLLSNNDRMIKATETMTEIEKKLGKK